MQHVRNAASNEWNLAASYHCQYKYGTMQAPSPRVRTHSWAVFTAADDLPSYELHVGTTSPALLIGWGWGVVTRLVQPHATCQAIGDPLL